MTGCGDFRFSGKINANQILHDKTYFRTELLEGEEMPPRCEWKPRDLESLDLARLLLEVGVPV